MAENSEVSKPKVTSSDKDDIYFISPRDIFIKMAASNATMKATMENSEISATAKAKAIDKTAIWAERVNTETVVVLEGRMGN